VYWDRMQDGTRNMSCTDFCMESSLTCHGAADDWSNDCSPSKRINEIPVVDACDVIKDDTSDLICICGPPPTLSPSTQRQQLSGAHSGSYACWLRFLFLAFSLYFLFYF